MIKKLSRFFSDNEIKVILFDLDDTLLNTNTIFVQKIHDVLDYLSLKLSLDHMKLSKKFELELIKAHKTVAVNPDKLWVRILNRCSATFKWKDEVTNEALDMLKEIYTTLPDVLPGVIPTLGVLKSNKKYLGLVTHASRQWTDFKLGGLGLAKFFKHIELFDINIHKNYKAWKNAIRAFKVQPKNVLVVGDSVKGDIQAASKAGVKNLVWVNRDEAWNVYKEGKVPEGTIVVRGIDELLGKLCECI